MMVVRLLLDRLERSGYRADARIVSARAYGVPQQRRRLIIVGARDGSAFDWPKGRGLGDMVSVREAIGDLPALRVIAGHSVGSPELSYRGQPESEFARMARKDCVGDAAAILHDH